MKESQNTSHIMTEDELKSLKRTLKHIKRLEKNEKRKNESKSTRKVA